MTDGIVLDSMETLRRITSAVRYVERLRSSTGNEIDIRTAQSPVPVCVEVTSTGKTSANYYEGKFVTRKEISAVTPWMDGDVCRVLGINDDTLTKDKRYLGQFVGFLEDTVDVGYPLVVVSPLASASLTSPLTTKGDIWGYSNVDTRIPVGSDGQVLLADSTQVLGVRWGSLALSFGSTTYDDFDITASAGSWQTVVDGNFTNLPAGTYVLIAPVSAWGKCNGYGSISIRWYNVTAGAAIGDPRGMPLITTAPNQEIFGGASLLNVVTFGVTTSVRLEAMRWDPVLAVTWTTSTLRSNYFSFGTMPLYYVRIG